MQGWSAIGYCKGSKHSIIRDQPFGGPRIQGWSAIGSGKGPKHSIFRDQPFGRIVIGSRSAPEEEASRSRKYFRRGRSLAFKEVLPPRKKPQVRQALPLPFQILMTNAWFAFLRLIMGSAPSKHWIACLMASVCNASLLNGIKSRRQLLPEVALHVDFRRMVFCNFRRLT